MKKERINWREVVREARKVAENFYTKYNEPLTLRGIFYQLVSLEVIPNTKSAYKGLSRVLSKARYRGEFPWHLIKDETRPRFTLETFEGYPTRPLSEDELKKILERYIESYMNVEVNPWEDQPYRIIVVLEKQALMDIVMSFIREVFEFGVYKLIVIRGYDSATDIRQIAEYVKRIVSGKKIAVVLMLTDFDPSGEDITRDLRERISRLVHNDVEDKTIFEKIAVTLDQIEKYNLPSTPESTEEITKMQRDPRFKKWKYGLFRVELDALVSLVPEEFKKILKAAIEKYFDYDIYEKVTKRREEELKKKAEEYRRQTYDNLRKLIGEGRE